MHTLLFLKFVLQSFVLGIVEGVTEFLPISSTGHLIVFERLLGLKNTSYMDMYTYVIQLGAILAVVVLYHKKIWKTLVNLIPKKGEFTKSGLSFWLVIVVACIPGFIATMIFGDIADKYLSNQTSVAITLFLGGILMIVMENIFRKKRHTLDGDKNVLYKQAIIIGIFQCLAIIPGMSRSASTIMGGWVAGLTTPMAAEFSFFLAIPVMIGMSLLKILKIGGLSTLTSPEIIALIIGFITAFVSALVVVKRFITYLQKRPMRPFAVYRMIFAIIIIGLVLAGLFK
jgi:undecaprenyl-diphosphatase UppP